MDEVTKRLYMGIETSTLESILEDQKRQVEIHTKLAEKHQDLAGYYRGTSHILEKVIADRMDKSVPLSPSSSGDASGQTGRPNRSIPGRGLGGGLPSTYRV